MAHLTDIISEAITSNTDYFTNKYGTLDMKQVPTIFTTAHPVGHLKPYNKYKILHLHRTCFENCAHLGYYAAGSGNFLL
jgi:hypothetical protein